MAQRLLLLLLLAAALAAAPASAFPGPAGPDLQTQREAFLKARVQAEAGRWEGVEPWLGVLEDYPLVPDLRAAWLDANLGPETDQEVSRFLASHDDLAFARGLRYRWALSLARREAWDTYLELYESSYPDGGDAVLRCHALTARISTGREAGLRDEALEMWLSPVSQPDACDPAFTWLEEQGALTSQRRRQRMELALDAGEFRLARWLARPLGTAAVAEVDRWTGMRAEPAARLADPDAYPDTDAERALVVYGFRRLASEDPERAADLWPAYDRQLSFSAADRDRTLRRIALIHAWRHLPGARQALEALPPEAHDDDTRAWTVRTLLREEDWAAALEALQALPPTQQQEPAWRYWRARMLDVTGAADQARPLFEALAGERGYHSFLSADRIGAEYAWGYAPTPAREDVIAALADRPDIRRTRELFYTGEESRGRVEWTRAMRRLSPEEQAQASILASRWGWYSQAISTASSSGLRNDLELRFPLPWRPVFEDRSRRAGIPSTWAYGIARSESLFMPDVVSRAGAVGLMQLMPATGRQTARSAGIPYRGRVTLTDPEANVTLGTTYLSSMLARFANNRVLATAAYNAGPHRVEQWLPETGPLDADVWVETVPFSETRGYVRRVLASEAVFNWRMSGETLRLTEVMQPVPPRP